MRKGTGLGGRQARLRRLRPMALYVNGMSHELAIVGVRTIAEHLHVRHNMPLFRRQWRRSIAIVGGSDAGAARQAVMRLVQLARN